jgi:zinc protease
MVVDFESAPERTDSLVAVAVDELRKLSTDGPSQAQTDKIREARTRDLDGESESNSYWAGELSWHARMGWSLGSIAKHQDEAKTLTREQLRVAAATYLKPTDYVLVTMVPKPRVGPQDASLGTGAGTGGAARATGLPTSGRSNASAPKVARTRRD